MAEGQAQAASMATTKAPEGMYVEMEYDDNIARGCVQVIELVAYDFDRMEKEKDEHTGKYTGKEILIEKGRKPCFCQTPEDEAIYKANNPKARIESFNVQLLKSIAIRKLNDPENMEQFINPERHQPMEDLTEEPTWRQQASKLGIKMYQRKKEDVLMDIVTALSKEQNYAR